MKQEIAEQVAEFHQSQNTQNHNERYYDQMLQNYYNDVDHGDDNHSNKNNVNGRSSSKK